MHPMRYNNILFVAFIKDLIFDICIPAVYQKILEIKYFDVRPHILCTSGYICYIQFLKYSNHDWYRPDALHIMP